MSEADKKGSPWPWILVPVAAISLFFVLRQCRQNLPPSEIATGAEAESPSDPSYLAPAEASPESAPTPQEPAP